MIYAILSLLLKGVLNLGKKGVKSYVFANLPITLRERCILLRPQVVFCSWRLTFFSDVVWCHDQGALAEQHGRCLVELGLGSGGLRWQFPAQL